MRHLMASWTAWHGIARLFHGNWPSNSHGMKIRDTPFGVFATAYGLYLLLRLIDLIQSAPG